MLKKGSLISISLFLLCSIGFSDSSELTSRTTAANEAYNKLKAGDVFYKSGEFQNAVEQYESAIALVQNVPATSILYSELSERFATASVEYAKELKSVGKYDEATSLLDTVLADEIAPNHAGAKQLRAYFDDPIRTNPALTYEHVQNIDQVRQLLYTAEGAYNLGKYDESFDIYEQVLAIDPYNKAARKGIERGNNRKADYGTTAKQHIRAKMLAEVTGGWELNEQREIDDSINLLGTIDDTSEIGATVGSKIRSIMIPVVDFDGVDLVEAIDFLRQQSITQDTTTLDMKSKGVQFVTRFEQDDPVSEKRFNLTLTNVPLKTVLDSISTLTGASYRTDEYGVIMSSEQTLDSSFYVKSYSVSPDFLSRVASTGAVESDPFGGIGDNNVLQGQRVSAKQVLEGYGVTFEDSASATFIPSTNTLVVSNTEKEHQFVSQILLSLTEDQPTMVALEVKLISIEQNNAEELGLEWAIEDFVGDAILTGGSVGSGTALGIDGRPITAGNRSGDNIFERDAIDDVIRRVQGTNGTLFKSFDPYQLAAGTGVNGVGQLALPILTNGTPTQLEPLRNAPGILSSFVTLSDSSVLNTMLRGLSQKKGTDFISKPHVVTRSGQVASVVVGREFIYPTEYEPPEISESAVDEFEIIGEEDFDSYIFLDNDLDIYELGIDGTEYKSFLYSISPSHPTSFETVILGTELELEPTVSEDKKTIQLNLRNTYRDFDGFINYGSPISIPGQSVQFDNNWLTSVWGVIYAAIFGAAVDYDDLSPIAQATLATIDITDQETLDAYTNGGLNDGEIAGLGFLTPPDIPFEFDRTSPLTNFGGIRVRQTFFEATKNNIFMPVFNKINTETSVTIADGATIVLGGLLKSKKVPYEDKVPILGDIPYLGRAFTSSGENDVRKVVLITVTARCIDPSGRPINQ